MPQYERGKFKCAKCGCVCYQRILDVKSGNVGANDEPCICPNECGPMWKVIKEEDDMITEEEYEAARKQKEAAEATMSAYHKQKSEEFATRMLTNPIFTPDELIYSAHARCKGCGAGLAYPKNCGGNHYWDCAAVLTGKVPNPGNEHEQYSFMFYDIKSELQPSAYGATTRETV